MGRHVPRKFLTKEVIDRICALKEQGCSVATIAEEVNISQRAVKDKLSELSQKQTNEWSKEEIEILIKLYQKGFRKPSDFKNYLTHKAGWMIRNKIKKLIKNGFQIPEEKPAEKSLPTPFIPDLPENFLTDDTLGFFDSSEFLW